MLFENQIKIKIKIKLRMAFKKDTMRDSIGFQTNS